MVQKMAFGRRIANAHTAYAAIPNCTNPKTKPIATTKYILAF